MENFSKMKVAQLKSLIKDRKLGAVSGKTKAQLVKMLQPSKETEEPKKSRQEKQSNKTVVNVYVSGPQAGQIPLVTQTQQGSPPQIIKPNFKISKEPAKKFNTVKIPGTDPTKPISASFSKASKPSSSSVGKLNLPTDFTSKLAGLFA